MSCLCCRKETGLSTPTSPLSPLPLLLFLAVCRREMRREREERARVVVVRGREAKEEKKEKERGITRRMEILLPADAVELIPCSIHCVMAASSYSSQSRHSCHWWFHPLQMVKQ
ncbi:uncharacterized protein V6R79_018156 [Siganus canaliculatus]